MRAAALVLALALVAGGASAQEGSGQEGPAQEGSGDWPCVQAKVPTLTPAAIWTGPAFEPGAADWASDAEVAALVDRLARRRLPIEEAEREVEAFAAGLGPDAEARLALLFAGLFERMDAERSQVIAGIERYARRQVAAADAIRAESAALDARRRAEDADPPAISEEEAVLGWRIRVFDERRGALPYACEVPRLIEQRLFALGRAIGSALEG